MLKKLLLSAFLLSLAMVAHLYARGKGDKAQREREKLSMLETAVRELPDSIFKPVEMEDLLNDEVYLKLAHEGWSPEEIVKIMHTAIADKKAAKKKFGYGYYAKQWLPAYGRQPGGDTLYQFVDTLYTAKMQASVARAVPGDLLNKSWPEIPYSPDDRKKGLRRPGYFRPVKFNPSCGRMHWAALHPEDPDKLYAVPDGAGIFKTDNCGETWTCITDNIPVRADRSQSNGYAIPVDPDDWDHVFAFMNNASVYETTNGGDTWRRIVGATHKGFKRGDCFRDADGNLKFIGAQRPGEGWSSKLWISEDTCKTWTEVIVPDSLKDVNPQTGRKGLWFQYITFDPNDRNRIYLPTSRSILYFDDGAKSETVNGKKVYNIKKMHFTVYQPDGVTVRKPSYGKDDPENDAIFPSPAQSVGDLVVNPNKPDQMWFATGSQITNCSAVYRSDDRGKTWITLSDPAFGIGSGNAFGNEMASVWLGGFGVNFADTTRIYGCSMSSAISNDGGRHFGNFNWAAALGAKHSDGNYYTASASRHNADNHFIRSHKSGRVFRGSDGGMLMIDPTVRADSKGNGIWTQIGGNMGQMLFYHIAVNEFGDQAMAGNTQDIDGQTYRYGRWGRWRGYEGSESFINPYTGAVYFSGSMGALGWDGDHMSLSSWRCATTRADVVSGSWFMARSNVSSANTFLRCDDLGQRVVSLYGAVGEIVGLNKFALARDKNRTTIFVCTNSNYYKMSTDGGNTFQPILVNGQPAKFSNSQLTADPDNSDILYIAINGGGNSPAKVFRLYVNEGRFEEVGTGLPAIPCTQLLFHEGSGDLYFYHSGSAGFYILERNPDGSYATNWRFWTKGYNSGKSGNAEINYTTQEMVICDYGRGVWVADLEHPSDRFFRNGFALKELSFKDGRRTLGIDTEWTIPLYYHFKWTVNGTEIDNPYQYLRRALEPGDRVQLTLTLRESPDVSTTSSVFVIPEVAVPDNRQEETASDQEGATEGDIPSGRELPKTESVDNTVVKEPGRAIYSNGRGRVDLGYHDYFFNDFSIDLWIKPMSDGTIIANRTSYGDNKGWQLSIENSSLKFQYSPSHTFPVPNYEKNFTQTDNVIGGTMQYNRWYHVAVTHQRYGNICLYINGTKVAEKARILPEHTLNNAVVLSLFGDAIERSTLEATIDELKIWSHALTLEEIRREMHSTNPDKEDGLVAYYPFNGGSLENDLEMFTRRHIKSRVRAEVQHPMMTVPTCAKHVSYESMSDSTHIFQSKGTPIIGLHDTTETNSGNSISATNFGIYSFDTSQWQNEEDNLDLEYFDCHPVGYLIRPFDTMLLDSNGKTKKFHVDFYPVEGEFHPGKNYRLYTSNPDDEHPSWQTAGYPEYDPETGALRISDMAADDLVNKKLLIVSLKPSIELVIEGLSDDGVLNVYDQDKAVYKIKANILEDLPEPTDIYHIESDGILLPSGLYFADGHADGEMRLDLSKLGAFNTSVRTTLRSNDNPVKTDSLGNVRASMIPVTIDVRNRIAPRQLGNAVKMLNGCMEVGNVANYQALRGSNKATIMGWVRVDSLKQLTGTHHLLSFRDASGTTALQLVNGKLSFVWSQTFTITTNAPSFTVTEADLGKWFHVAAVVRPNGVDLYFNGIKAQYSRTVNLLNKGLGCLLIGKSTAADAWTANNIFCGAFDQIGVWNRSLTQEEVIKYMYETVRLDDPGLLSYLNMDYFDENGVMRDCYHLGEVRPIENNYYPGKSVSFNEPSIVPFDAKASADTSADDAVISLSFPEGKNRNATVTTFRGTPYCYLNHDFQEYTALNKEYYALTFHNMPISSNQDTENETITLTYRHRTILGNENLTVAMRRTGTQEHLAGFFPAASVSEGVATFEVPSQFLQEASEIMFFTAPSSDPGVERPAYIQLSFAGGIANNSELMLQEGENTIGINADVIGGNINNDVRVVVTESNYAKADVSQINMTATESHFNIVIDRDKIDKTGMNTLTINLEGAKSNELRLNFYLEPLVRLTLKNGDESEVITPTPDNPTGDNAPRMNTYRATSPISTLEVEAELVEGYLTENVKLEILTDLDNSMNISHGNLLRNEAVTIGNLEHHPSPTEGSIVEGWNLIGNPYLANINLTKSQNVEFNPERVTKFLYQCNPATGNYSVYDMTDYDSEQKIHPFQSYFVQTMAENAGFTVLPVAKEENPSKRTMAYTAVEKQELHLELYKDDILYDRVTLTLDNTADENFVTNEDAPKLWNLSGSSPELYAMTDDGHPTSVNVSQSSHVTLGLNSPDTGTMALRMASMGALSSGYIVKIHDNATKKDWVPQDDGNLYEFPVDQTGRNDNRFTVTMNSIISGTESVCRPGYRIFVEDLQCIITGLKGNAMVSIYTPNGVNILRTHTSEPTLEVSLQEGVYIVVIREIGKDYSAKILVK